MASIRDLKKEINFVFGSIIEECYLWEALHPSEDRSKTDAIINEAIADFDRIMAEVCRRGIMDKKAHFRGINEQLVSASVRLTDRIGELS